jgi:small GTP-binding protein
LRFIKGDFKDSTKATIGVEFMHKMMTVNGTKVKVTLWDTAGQEVYRALSKVYYKGALGVILVYDVTN